jgi:hypothetical protein
MPVATSRIEKRRTSLKMPVSSASINELKPEENNETQAQGATIDESTRAEKDVPHSARIDDSKPKEKDSLVAEIYSNDMIVVNDPVKGEDSEDDEDSIVSR